jgi:hypothetical protein
MEEKFERVEKHLYRRQYQTAGGEWTTLYYARFKDWKGKNRTFSIGSNLKVAREELIKLEARNIRKEDFDQKPEPDPPEPERLTIGKYLPRFLETKKALPSCGFYEVCGKHLERLLGPLTLEGISRTKIAEYKQIRLAEPIQRHGNPVEGSLISKPGDHDLDRLVEPGGRGWRIGQDSRNKKAEGTGRSPGAREGTGCR